MWTRSELKTKAKEALRLNYWKAVLVALICSFVSGGGGGGSSSYSSSSDSSSSSSAGSLGSLGQEDAAALLAIIGIVLVVVLVVLALSFALSAFLFMPLYVGCCRFFINCSNGNADLNDVTYVFSHSYLNVVKIMFLQSLYTFFWSLLFIIPGIVKGYEYHMIPYLLAEDPSLSKADAFRLTKEMMTGDKWNTFVLGLSFIGWELLSVITCCILFVFYVAPYEQLTFAELYKALKYKISDPRFVGTQQMAQQTVYGYETTNTTQNPYL